MSRPLGSLRSKAARLQLSFLFNFLSSTRLSRTLQKNTDEGRGQLSPTRRGSIQWRGRWRRRSEDHGVERQKATLKIRQITRKSHTKLHMYRGKLLCQSGIPVQTIESQEPPRLLWRRLQLTRQDPNFARDPERKEAKRPARRGAP